MKAFKQAREPTAAPVCESCSTEMTWSHSELIAAENAVVNLFTCRTCDRVIETRTPAKAEK